MITDCLEDSLNLIKSDLDKQLFSADSLVKIYQIAELLPNFPSLSDAGFECHLNSPEARTDFLVAFNTLNRGRKTFADFCQTFAKSSHPDSAWICTQDFGIHWQDSDSPLYQNVENVWLEFDLDKEFKEIPEPCFFLSTQKVTANDKESASSTMENKYRWITEDVAKLLLKNSLSNKVKDRVLECLDLLPSQGKVTQIGFMLPRQNESQMARLVVRGIAKDRILEYLGKIGWSGSIEQLSPVITELSSYVDTIALNFAVGDIIPSKIGFECYFQKQPQNSKRCQLFLDYLVKNQLCTQERATTILNWSGYSEIKPHQTKAESNITRASAFVNGSFKSTIVRLLNHIKIVYQPERPLQAKAYFWFGHRWLSARGLFERSSGNCV